MPDNNNLKGKTMQVQKNSPSFGRLTRDEKTISKELYNAIKETPTVKKFGRKYNATVSLDSFYSSRIPNKTQLGLRFENITPVNIFSKVKNFFRKNFLVKTVLLKTHAVNEQELINSLSKKSANAIINLYKKI